MRPFELEKTYHQFMALPHSDRSPALDYMRLALEASKHNLDVAYFNQQEAIRVKHDAQKSIAPPERMPTGWGVVQGGDI